jgi:transposase
MKNSVGRPVDLSDIDISELQEYIKNNKNYRDFIKCHSIISLYEGRSMQHVCTVMGVTRETIRKWKERLRKGGLKQLLTDGKVGKRAKINSDKLAEIKRIVKKSPAKFGYEQKKWTGIILVDYLQNHWNIDIGIRTAQLWLKKM